jgi:hypothetical protein
VKKTKGLTVTGEMFKIWKNDPITKFVFSELETLKLNISAALTDTSFLLAEDSRVKIARLVGERDAIDSILNINFVPDEISDVE